MRKLIAGMVMVGALSATPVGATMVTCYFPSTERDRSVERVFPNVHGVSYIPKWGVRFVDNAGTRHTILNTACDRDVIKCDRPVAMFRPEEVRS